METKQLNNFYVYYIDSFLTKCNGYEIIHFYSIDKKMHLNKYTKIVEETDLYYVFETNIDGTPRQLKGFKTKDFAEHQIELINKEKYNDR